MSDEESAQIFRVEAQELFDTVEHELLDLERSPADMEAVNKLFRALHTLKGSGAMFGFDALADIAHQCETAFDRIRKGDAQATPELICAVLAALDQMRALAEGGEVSEDDNAALMAILQTTVAKPVAGDLPQDITGSEDAGEGRWHISMRFPSGAFRTGTRPLVLLDDLRDIGIARTTPVTETIPLLDTLEPKDCFLGWDVDLETDSPKSEIEDVFAFDALTMELQITARGSPDKKTPPPAPEHKKPQTVAKAEAPPEEPSPQKKAPVVAHPLPVDKMAVAVPDETIRVPATRLDDLMNRVGELVIAQSRLKQISDTIADETLHTVAEEVERLASDLRESMMSVRMVPVAQLFGRFRRLVHDLARETKKSITYVTSGESTELDKTVIERLADPLIHLIRNSADHGLEPPEERIASGKSPSGQISLSARQAGGEVIITVADNGRGINRDRVRTKAEEAGLIPRNANLKDEEIFQLIFQPGFSTAGKVTGISGRGVGMDAVKRAIEALRGTVDISSKPGEGSRIHLRLPLTLAIIDGLLVRVGDGRYVIPLSAVEECLEISPAEDLRAFDRSLIVIRDRFVPFLRLRVIFNTGTEPDPYQKMVVVSGGTERVGLIVDEILGDHQTVIKPLSCFHSIIGMFSGATILGDGSLALILDAANLITRGRQIKKRDQDSPDTGGDHSPDTTPELADA